jgi:transcription initiation factor TFIIB
MNSNMLLICLEGGKHKPVSDIIGETLCQKCGMVLLEPEPDIPFNFRPETKEYDLGSWVGESKKEFKKVAPRIRFADPGFDLILAKAKALTVKYAQLISSQKIIITRAMELFKKSRKLLRGRDTETFVAACIHIACREQGIPSSPNSIAMLTHVKKDNLSSFFNKICKLHEIVLPLDKASNKVRYVASRVGLPEKISRVAIKTLDNIPSSKTGSNPTGIAAAVLYICQTSEYPITLRQLSEATNLSPQAIGQSVKRIKDEVVDNA